MKNKQKKVLFCLLLFFFLIVIIIGILLGSIKENKNIYTCKSITKENNYSIKNTYRIYHKKDKVYKVHMIVEIDSKNNSIRKFYKNNYLNLYKKEKEKYTGYTIETKKEKNKEVINIIINYEKVKLREYIKDNSYLEKDVRNNYIDIKGIYKIFDLNKEKCKN